MNRLLLALALLVLAAGHARAEAAASDDGPAKLRVTLGAKLFLGLRLDIAPGLMVAKSRPVGATGLFKLYALHDFVIVMSEVDSGLDGSLRWSAGVHLGPELQPVAVAKRVLRESKRPMRLLGRLLQR
jgi:hypothetical protein